MILTQEIALFYLAQIHTAANQLLNSEGFMPHTTHTKQDIPAVIKELVERDLIETETVVNDGTYFLTQWGYEVIENELITKQKEEYVAYADAIKANKPLTKFDSTKLKRNALIFLVVGGIVTGLIFYNLSQGKTSSSTNIDFLNTQENLLKYRDK